MTKKTPSAFPGCYAKHLGNCNGKSGEHFISESILETISPFTVEGFPWLKPGEKRQVSAKSLTASVLCEHHNNSLSEFDKEASSFFDHIKLLDSKTTPEELEKIIPIFTIDGIKLEKWLLKALCGIIASGNCLIQGKGHGKIQVSEHLLNLLFLHEPWKLGIGLYAELGSRTRVNAKAGIGYDPVFTQVGTHATIVGIDVHFWGFPLRGLFATYEDNHPLANYRPSGLHIANGTVTREIKFIWPSNSITSEPPVFIRTGTIRPTA